MRRPLSTLDGQATWLSGRGVIVPPYVQALSLEITISEQLSLTGVTVLARCVSRWCHNMPNIAAMGCRCRSTALSLASHHRQRAEVNGTTAMTIIMPCLRVVASSMVYSPWLSERAVSHVLTSGYIFSDGCAVDSRVEARIPPLMPPGMFPISVSVAS